MLIIYIIYYLANMQIWGLYYLSHNKYSQFHFFQTKGYEGALDRLQLFSLTEIELKDNKKMDGL